MGPEALAELIDRHGAALLLYARQWCPAPEDVVQEALLKLVTCRPTPAVPVAWLYRVVRNTAVSAARSARRRRRYEATAAACAPAWFVAPEPSGLDADAAAAALAALPLEQREAIVAHLWGGLTFEQIAVVADTSASTAYRRYLAGLSALRQKLGVPCPTTSATRS